MHNKGTSIKELAELYNVHQTCVYKTIKRWDVLKSPREPYSQVFSTPGKLDELRNLRLKGYNIAQLARYFGCSDATIHYQLNKMRIGTIKVAQPQPVMPVDSAYKNFVPPLIEPIQDKPQPKQETKPMHDTKTQIIVINNKPTQFNTAEFGTQVLDITEHQLYVQMNHDRNNPLWMPINKPEKKGILSRVKGWFSK